MYSMGIFLRGDYDLTVFPASAKGMISASTKSKAIDMCKIEFPSKMDFGGLSNLYKLQISNPPSKYLVYAASVHNDFSSFDKIKSISKKLGEITKNNNDIGSIEVPLLGTGEGRLPDNLSALALKEGF